MSNYPGGQNKVTIIGYVGKEPELKFTASGIAVVSFGVATTKRWKDKDNAPQEKTHWHQVVAYRSRAEFISKNVHKGTRLFVEGAVEYREWNDKRVTEIIADKVEIMDRRTSSEGTSMSEQPENIVPYSEVVAEPEGTDDIPF